ncbi:MAG: 50S ribosomal protein L9 [Desulfobacteraceae bacterium 4572_187]|nr:MAG: 50S ribosomal protein L9 [Desulfobacteraceae bacterium 4572_187]
MKIILKETINSLGIIGSEATVAKGYARNYLFPQNKAVLQIAKERKIAEEMAEKLEGVSCTIAAKVSEEERLYGSVTVRNIIDVLQKQDISIKKRMVLLKEPIKTIGTFKVPIRVYKEVEPEITVEIVPE